MVEVVIMNICSKERTGWRDTELTEKHQQYMAYSNRHREYGACQCTDLDLIVTTDSAQAGPYLEIDPARKNRCVAAIEAKHYKASETISISAYATIGDILVVPYFLVVYYPPQWVYDVYAISHFAESYLPHQGTLMSEKEYVEFLHRLRGWTRNYCTLSYNDSTTLIKQLEQGIGRTQVLCPRSEQEDFLATLG